MGEDYYTVLAGGVGAAKFIQGLVRVVDSSNIKIVINTGDDIELFGLRICPDIDIITYSIAEVVDKEKGWGFENETFNCLSILKNYYDNEWFNLGDKDLAIHIYRTDLFRKGFTKAQITSDICKKLGIKAKLIPMSDESVTTYIDTSLGKLHFEEYYIKHKCKPEILDISFNGSNKAKPVRGVIDYIKNAKKVIICPSNPIVSIGTILSVKEIKKTLISVKDKVYAISPIIEGSTVKGPANKMMDFFGYEVSSLGVAKFYKEIIGHFIIDRKDQSLKPQIEELGIKTYCFDTLMTNIQKKESLARDVINL
ncbi:MAG: 2-phospho-L-lactate transferase [Candidatus Lokiarchaeota archaeon]|nr:2-phospho-L-lactate transferase [Candidatus Lokiarchaeota archaeon]